MNNIHENFRQMIDRLASSIIIRNKSFKEWEEYFDVNISDADDLETLRLKLRETSQKFDECSNLMSELKLTAGHASMNESATIMLSMTEILNNQETKTKTDAERRAKARNYELTVMRKLGELLVEAWKDQVDKLRSKLKMLEIHIYSYNAEMKTLNYKRNSYE